MSVLDFSGMGGPLVAKTESKVRVNQIEENLGGSIVEKPSDESETRCDIAESVAVPDAESLAAYCRNIGLRLQDFHTDFVFKIAIAPDVMIPGYEVYGGSIVCFSGQCSQSSGVSFRYDMPVFVPEVEDVPQKVDGFGFFRKGVEEGGKAFVLLGTVDTINAEMDIGNEISQPFLHSIQL